MLSLQITRRAADRLRAGHFWVYRSDLEPHQEEPVAGQLVGLHDNHQASLGVGLYSTTSQIAVRVVDSRQDLAREAYLREVNTRIGKALALRRELGCESVGNNAYRLLFSEADGLPGIIADRYGDIVVLQLLTQGTAQADVRQAVTEALRTALSPDGEPLTIWERQDARIRNLEQLAPVGADPLFTNRTDPPPTSTFALNGLQFRYDVGAGQKTGAFLDQRLNYASATQWIAASGRTDRALDVCTYQGGFALHLAQVCDRVTGVDQSRTALEIADLNLTLNPNLEAEVDWIEADAFDLLAALDEATRGKDSNKHLPVSATPAFDAIVLDPPAFAKSKRAAEGAIRGYKELNLRAMRLLAPGGTLVTCSCSHHVSLEDFTAAVSAAASGAGRRVQLLETRAAAPDHPEVLTLPETRYLKCLICRID